jgi:hypothetical protein
VLQIIGDKYDSGYRFRRIVAKKAPRIPGPVVLLPSSYVNVSRSATEYARAIPDLNFFLVSSRSSALLNQVPQNVFTAPLASYAPSDDNAFEFETLLGRWRELQARLAFNEDWAVLSQVGALDAFPMLLRNGLAVRNAWRRVFDTTNIQAVLCGDEMNPSTRLPICIANHRGIRTLAFHHGALDGRYRYRNNTAELMLAKSAMEFDYLVTACGMRSDGSLALLPAPETRKPLSNNSRKSSILFFSEPYELVGTRCHDVYREVLPELAKLARAQNCELLLKLHPQESRRERERIARSVLNTEEFRVVDGPLTPGLLKEAWCAVTVASTGAVNSFDAGIPAFLCMWLDRSHYGYGQQFAKYAKAIPLHRPTDIAEIPQLVSTRTADPSQAYDGGTAASRLKALLEGSESRSATNALEAAWA